MELLEVDPRDGAAFAAWFAVLDAVSQHDRPGEPDWSLQEQRALAVDGLPRPDGTAPDELRTHLAAVVGGRTVGAARLELPTRDNQHLASVWVGVLPPERRRGIGRLLLDEALRRAGDAGRSVVAAEVDEPPALAGRSPGRRFAESAGFRPALVTVRRDLPLPVPGQRLDRLEEQCRAHGSGYRLVRWRDHVPDDLVDGRADLSRRLSTDAPVDDLDLREEYWDAARVRRQEDLAAAQGRTVVAAGAVHEATGALVAYSDLALVAERPERVFQWDTVVRADHRGRRLGLAVKLQVLRELAEHFPAARYVSTWNAASNRHMIAVNEALGFSPNGEVVEVQRTL